MFDELRSRGFQGFLREHDPYWDVPLNDQPAGPVMQLSVTPVDSVAEQPVFQFTSRASDLQVQQPKAGRGRKDRGK